MAGELFDFDVEVEPLLEVLVGRVLEQALMEVVEEEELAALREHQAHFEALRYGGSHQRFERIFVLGHGNEPMLWRTAATAIDGEGCGGRGSCAACHPQRAGCGEVSWCYFPCVSPSWLMLMCRPCLHAAPLSLWLHSDLKQQSAANWRRRSAA